MGRKSKNDLPPLYPLAQAASMMGRSESTVYHWIADGRIKSIDAGGYQYIPKTEIERVWKHGTPKQPPADDVPAQMWLGTFAERYGTPPEGYTATIVRGRDKTHYEVESVADLSRGVVLVTLKNGHKVQRKHTARIFNTPTED